MMKKRIHKSIDKQRGLGLVTAIFVITVMAFLAVVINQLVQNNAETTVEETALIKAFYAAQSGVQFTLNAIFPPAGSLIPSICTPTVTCSGTNAYPYTGVGLNACSAEVVYSSLHVDIDSDGTVEDFYTLTSTGTCGDVSRTIQIRAQ